MHLVEPGGLGGEREQRRESRAIGGNVFRRIADVRRHVE